MAVRNVAFVAGSSPPSFAAIVITFSNFGKIVDILLHLFSFAVLRASNALPIILSFLDSQKYDFLDVLFILYKMNFMVSINSSIQLTIFDH
jgi:hypothetical protein